MNLIPSTNLTYAAEHRGIKAVRKMCASQATSSGKLVRLQAEVVYTLELAKKKDYVQPAQQVWETRLVLVDLNLPGRQGWRGAADRPG